MTKSLSVKIGVAFLAIYVIWGTTFLGIRIAVETIPPFLMAGLRFFCAGGAMLLMGGGKLPSLVHWRSALIVGGLMLGGGIGLVSFAESHIPSGLAALVVTTVPIWITLFDWLIFGGKRPRSKILMGLSLGFVGAILLFAPAMDARQNDLAGMGIVLVGTMFFSMGSLYSRRADLPDDTWISTGSEMFAGGVLLILFSLMVGEAKDFELEAISTRSALALLYLTVIGSIIGYTAYLWLLKTVEPTAVSTNFYVNPIIAVFIGWLLADERVTLLMLLAAGLILVGVAIIQLTEYRQKQMVESISST